MSTPNATPAVLVTIPLSHYCEKARWALDRADVPYRESPHPPLLHQLATRRHGGRSVPILLLGERCLLDSTAILRHADETHGGGLLYPRAAAERGEVERLVAEFDAVLGPQTRRWAYAQLMSQPALLRTLWSGGALPPLEARLAAMLTPVTRRLVRKAYRTTPEGAARALDKVRAVFQQVAERLGSPESFLVGGRFTAADLTFAALAAPVLLPPGCRAVQPALEVLPGSMREVILGFRDSIAGRFVLRLFAEER